MTEPYHVLDWKIFNARYPAALLQTRGERTRRWARALREKFGALRVLGVAIHPRHDQTTLWWFEQGILSLLAETGWKTTWRTDAHYLFDSVRLGDGNITVRRDVTNVAQDACDVVISLVPSDVATREARRRDVPLVAFGIKSPEQELPRLREPLPEGCVLWHGFAGSRNFKNALGSIGAERWPLRGLPFPVNRYYFPLRSVDPPIHDVLLFGSNSRDVDLACGAVSTSRARTMAALCNPEDAARVREAGRRHGIDVTAYDGLSHIDLLELIEKTRVVLNPIVPPAESHYSNSVPLALGRPLVVSDIPSTQPFLGDGVRAAALGDHQAWTRQIDALLDETKELPHRGALTQGRERHDLDRFYAAALMESLQGITSNRSSAR